MVTPPSGQAPVHVNVMNFVRAESDTYFDGLAARAGGINRWHHVRDPTLIEAQTVIRMNRDTLYSSIIVDLSDGATLTCPLRRAGTRLRWWSIRTTARRALSPHRR